MMPMICWPLWHKRHHSLRVYQTALSADVAWRRWLGHSQKQIDPESPCWFENIQKNARAPLPADGENRLEFAKAG